MGYRAYIAEVDNYSPEAVRAGLEEMIGSLGGMRRFVQQGQRVLIKPNLIAKRFESQTNPVVVVEVAKLALACGAEVGIADSTAWHSAMTNAKSSGLLAMAEANGIPVYELKRPRKIRQKGRYQTLTVASEALEADVIINVPKLKAHQQLKLSAGIKNMFGCVPGKRKAVWHLRAGGHEPDFGRMLMQTFLHFKPVLTIIDAIDAMEGKGPINGTLRHVGAIVGSESGLAAEVTACELINCDPMSLVTMQAAKEMGLGPTSLDQIELLGAELNKLKIDDFYFPPKMPIGFSLPRVVKSIVKQIWLLQKEKFETRE
jgi:uncharacterized protein (DUF362 family)